MNCEPEKLTAYILGDLQEGDAKAVESHAAACAFCSQRLAELRRTVDVLAALPEAEERPADVERLKSAAASRNSLSGVFAGVRGLIARRPRWAVGLAAACLAVLSFHYGFALRIGSFEIAFGAPPQETPAQVQPAVVPASLVWDETALRGLVRDEIRTSVTPAVLELARYYDAQLEALHDTFAAQRTQDMMQVRDNIRFVANAVEESLGVR